MIAICTIRPLPHYRRDAFERGLRAVGYRMVTGGTPAGPEDLLVQWNRYGAGAVMADNWEARGGTVLVCENGYAGKDEQGRQYYAISAHGHNGSGWFPVGTEDRWAQLGIDLQPWRTEGKHILVCGQRGIGSATMASPAGWHHAMAARLRKVTDRPVRIREHPGNKEPAIPLADDLRDAWACVIWSSGAGVKAMISGVPVYYDAPHWICDGAATPASHSRAVAMDWIAGAGPEKFLDLPDDRLLALRKMAWAQFSVAEIESGAPFAGFRDAVRARAKAAA